MNVINDNLRDNYTNSKRKAEKILTMENLIIIRQSSFNKIFKIKIL